MSFSSIFKKSFLEGYASSEITISSIISCLVISLLIGLFIFVVYRLMCRKEFYNKNFNIALVAISIITSAIILTVQSSVVISLGMVGALSIVRFRTAIKDPLDLIFLFWSISIGIICGAGLSIIAVAFSLLLAVILWILNSIPVSRASVIMLVSSSDISAEQSVMKKASELCSRASVKSRTLTDGRLDLIIEIKTKNEGALASAIKALDSVTSVSIVAHNGEVTF